MSTIKLETQQIEELAQGATKEYVENRLAETKQEVKSYSDGNLATHNSGSESHQDIRTAISNEATAREAADTSLSTAISNESSTRAAADIALGTRIDNIESRGRYLSSWNATTGLPGTEPETMPYAYKTGDYFIISTIGTTNYKPTGSQYTGTASTVLETGEINENDTYLYDGTSWELIHTEIPKIAIDDETSTTSRNPVENRVITNAINGKVDKVTGKQLSTEDYTTAEKTKLSGLENYDDTEVKADIADLETDKQDKLTAGENITIDENNVISSTTGPKPYLSLERNSEYLYTVTFDKLSEENDEIEPAVGGCTSFVRDGKLYRNLDWNYDNTASFRVITKDFEGISFINGLNSSNLDDDLIAQLPYHMNDGVNKYGIMVSTHVLFNDWEWTGTGETSITRIPYLILKNAKSMTTLSDDIGEFVEDITIPQALQDMGYMLQFLVTDGVTTKIILPPTEGSSVYSIVTANTAKKLTNFRWVDSNNVIRTSLQTRPTGVERWNEIGASTTLEDLRFTEAYEAPTRLSEFIGIDGTTKDSTDAELEAIYDEAHDEYESRERDGKTWQTMHSVVYGSNGMERLYVQENWDKNYIFATKDYVDEALGDKQDKLTAGTNITIDANNVISAAGGSSYEFIEEGNLGSDEYLSIGDYDFDTENGGTLSFLKQYDGPDLSARYLLSRGIDYADLRFNNEFLVSDVNDDVALFVSSDGAFMSYDEDSSMGVADGFAVITSGDTTVMAEDGSFSIRTGTGAAYYNHNGVPQPEDEIATVGYVDEHAGGETLIEAGKGIDIEEYEPLSITMEVTGQLPLEFESILPVSINLSGVKPGTNLNDLYLDGKLDPEKMFYWDRRFNITTSGIDSDVISIAETENEHHVIQFNGTGTTTGTITAARDALSYTANVTVTITAGESVNRISADIYDLGWDFYDNCISSLDYDESIDGEDALAALGGHDGFVEFVKAVKNDAKFIMNLDGQSVYFERITSASVVLSIQHQFVGSLPAAKYDIYFEEGDDESVEITKYRAVEIFNDEFDGLVPASSYADRTKFLRGDGTWADVGSGVEVVQSTGSSTAAVMSQKAVTDELNNKASQSQLSDVAAAIPTKTSDLTNDSNFATETYVDNAVPDVVNSLSSTSTADALSANQGKILKGLVDDLDTSKQDTLTAGTNITIDANNVISAAGGGTQIEAGKGIEVEEYSPLSITMEVTGELPTFSVGTLPLSLSLSDVKPGTNMYDLYTEGTLTYEQMLSWDRVYTMSTSGIDSDVISVVLTNNNNYIQFNGTGTTTGTITATAVGGTSYTVNVTVTITTSEFVNKISEDIYDFGTDFFTYTGDLDFDETLDGEDALAALGGHDGFVNFVKAIKNNANFIMNLDGEIIYFETIASSLMSGIAHLTIQHQSSDVWRDASRYDIRFEEGDDESIEIEKHRAIDEFNSTSAGIVPATGPSPANKYLRGNRTWQTLNTYALTLTLEDDTTVTLNLKGE